MQRRRPFPFLNIFFTLITVLVLDSGTAAAFGGGGGRGNNNNNGGGGNSGTSYLACPGVGSVSVNANYQADANGAYCMIRNQNGNDYNFTVNGQPKYLADPSVIRIAGYYYLSGTTDELNNWNYNIYRSRDLVSWELFKTAFDPATFQGQQYCNLWAPHIYHSPSQPDQVWISFTATQSGNQNLCGRSDSSRFISVYAASMPLTRFTAPGRYFGAPAKYGYNWNGSTRYDGGVAARRAIPVSADTSNFGNAPGQTRFSDPPCVNTVGGSTYECAATLRLDSFVFVDPLANSDQNRMRMLYTWFGPRQGLWAGNNIASHRMVSDLLMDSRTSASIRDLAYQVNTWNKIDDRYLNGSYSNQGGCESGDCGGVAEGPSAFYRDGRYYLVFSRNPFDSPAYGMFYRMTNRGQPFDTLLLSNWRDQTIRERTLVVSDDRETPRGVSFGHGDIFQGPTVAGASQQYYTVMHMKEANSYNRIPFFKELTFNSDGTIEPTSNAPNADYKHSVMWFRVPRPQR